MPKGKYIKSESEKQRLRTLNIGREPWNKGKKGLVIVSSETRKKLSNIRKGNNNACRVMSEKEKRMRSDIAKKRGAHFPSQKLNMHHNWRGGISFEIYPIEWKNTLKIAIRERDRYICKICGEKQGEVTHAIHHIDYNKKNCNPDNLITLCRSCHAKTNYNREKWIKYFYEFHCNDSNNEAVTTEEEN